MTVVAMDADREVCWCPICGWEYQEEFHPESEIWLEDGRLVCRCLGCQIGILHRVLLLKEFGDG